MTFPTAAGAPRAFGYEPAATDHEREAANLETARRYLAAIEAGSAGDAGSATESAGFAVLLEFRDGRIHRQRNYDCFEPF
jgi:hypothetical protein